MPGAGGTALIVGAGLAGARCAEALRRGGYRGRIVLAGDEPGAPYDRPALSKSFLAGYVGAPDLALRSPEYWRSHAIELRTGSPIAAIDAGGSATTACGTQIAWDALVLATGARARRLPGDYLAGAHRLRTIGDAVALRRDLSEGRRLAILGGGFLGLEVASTACALGLDVTLVTREEAPLAAKLGPVVGAIVADRAREAGVRVVAYAEGAAIRPGADGRVAAVALASGEEIPCDVALVAIGAEPAAELARGLAPLAADGGVATDLAGRTDRDGVFACGDVASAWRPWLGDCRSLGHWTAAASGARAVAAAILGTAPVRPDVPYASSDAFGLHLQVLGGPPPRGAELSLEAAGPEGFAVSYRRGGTICCAVIGNHPQRAAGLRRELAVAWKGNLGETSDDGLAAHTTPR